MIMSAINKPVEVFHYHSAVRSNLTENLVYVIILKCILHVSCDVIMIYTDTEWVQVSCIWNGVTAESCITCVTIKIKNK